MPLITAANARILAAKAHEARRQRKLAAAEALARLAQITATPDDMRANRTRHQLDTLDAMIDKALERRDYDALPTLTAAKERLWKLVQPTAGQLKPSRRAVPGPGRVLPILPAGSYQPEA